VTAALTADVANMIHTSASVSGLGRCQVRASACYNTEIFNPQTKGDDMEMLFLCFFHLLALGDSGMRLRTTTRHVQLLRQLHHMHNKICLNNTKGCPKQGIGQPRSILQVCSVYITVRLAEGEQPKTWPYCARLRAALSPK